MKFKVFERLYWSTPVWECLVSSLNNNIIKDYCLEVRKHKPGVNISNKGGWHSNELIHPIPEELSNLFNQITNFVNNITTKFIGVDNLILGNWWININGQFDYNMPHNHQNSILSGVYYVSVPQSNMGNLILHREDNIEYFYTSKITKKETPTNMINIECPVEESKFYLFPSWVKHSVDRNESPEERISIAFNFISPDQFFIKS